MRRLLLISAMAALTTCALAQGFPPPDGQGGPPQGGPGGPGFGPGPMGMGIEPLDRLVMRHDVQSDLNLTDDQKAQIRALRPQRGPGGPGGGPGGPGGPPPGGDGFGGPPPGGQGGPPQGGPPDGQGGPPPGGGGPNGGPPDFDAMEKKMATALKKILTSDQWTRLKGIEIQVSGSAAVMDPEIQKDVALTAEQKAAIKKLARKQAEANRAVMDKARDGEIERDEVESTLKKNRQVLRDQIDTLLSENQKSQLKALAGKEFKAEERPRDGGGGGGF